MTTPSAETPSLRYARDAISRLSRREKAQLISEIVQELAILGTEHETDSSDVSVSYPIQRGSPLAITNLPRWEGDDLDDALAAVYASRSPLQMP